MRIIGGALKGKTILPPNNYAARPTTDFAKEGLFNMLINEFDLEEISVLDLFSGTGSISMEFASRGCKDIISIEMNPLHTRFIKQCSQSFKIKGMQVIRHNVFDFIKICTKSFDIIFADPPYDLEGLDTLPDRIFGITPTSSQSGASEAGAREVQGNTSEAGAREVQGNTSEAGAREVQGNTPTLPEGASEAQSDVCEKKIDEFEKEFYNSEKKFNQLVKKGGYFILEHPKSYSFDNHPFFIKEKKYGNVHFSFFGEKE